MGRRCGIVKNKYWYTWFLPHLKVSMPLSCHLMNISLDLPLQQSFKLQHQPIFLSVVVWRTSCNTGLCGVFYPAGVPGKICLGCLHQDVTGVSHWGHTGDGRGRNYMNEGVNWCETWDNNVSSWFRLPVKRHQWRGVRLPIFPFIIYPMLFLSASHIN